MKKFELSEGDAEALGRIVAEHAQRLGKRKSVPVGRSVFDVAQELNLCEKLAEILTGEVKSDVEIGVRKIVSRGPK